MEINYSVTKRIGDHTEKHRLEINGADASLLDRILALIHTPQEEKMAQSVVPEQQKRPSPPEGDAVKLSEGSENIKTDADIRTAGKAIVEAIAKGLQTSPPERPKKKPEPEMNEDEERELFLKTVDSIQVPKARPKRLPLQSGSKSSFPVNEIVAKKEQDMRGDRPLYSTRCVCPSCGHDHLRRAPETNRYIKCKNCGERLEMQQATPNFLEPNGEGVYFLASRVFQ